MARKYTSKVLVILQGTVKELGSSVTQPATFNHLTQIKVARAQLNTKYHHLFPFNFYLSIIYGKFSSIHKILLNIGKVSKIYISNR